jgi:hypothetical protein
MEALDIQTPVLSPGARVEVDYGAGVVVCRLCAWHRTTLHLSVPPGAHRTLQRCEGTPVRLTLYPPPDRRQATGDGHEVANGLSAIDYRLSPVACLESEASMRGWIWTRPPLLVVGPHGPWREKWRRTAHRAERQLAARLVLEDGMEYVGRTQDVSAGGVSMMLAGSTEIGEGARGRLTLEVEEGHWCDDLPVRIARARHWLHRAGRTVEIGAEFRPRTEAQNLHWQQCLARLGVEA